MGLLKKITIGAAVLTALGIGPSMYYQIKSYPLGVKLEQIAHNEYHPKLGKDEIAKMNENYDRNINNMTNFDLIGLAGLFVMFGCGSFYVDNELEKIRKNKFLQAKDL